MNKQNDNQPLVSIIVITYNSSKYVLETLESAKAQSYQSIELIVSDDCSTDNTVNICHQWIEENKERFVRTELITVEKNTGIPANCNRGVIAAEGEWVKLIAGDDALLEKCISDNMEFIKNIKDVFIVFSIKKQYIDVFSEENFLSNIPKKYIENFFGDHISASNQYELLLIADRIGFTATNFMKKSALMEVGLFDEKYKLIEDYPMWLKLTKAGFKLHFMPIETIKHRKHRNAVFNTTEKQLIKPAFIRNEAFRKEHVYPFLKWHYRMDYWFRYRMSLFLSVVSLNKSNKITRQISKLLLKYLNPFYWILKQKQWF